MGFVVNSICFTWKTQTIKRKWSKLVIKRLKNNVLIAYIHYDTQRAHHLSGNNRCASFLYLAFVLGKWCIPPPCPYYSARGSRFHLDTIKNPETGCHCTRKLSWRQMLHPPHLLLSPILCHILASVLCVFPYQLLQLHLITPWPNVASDVCQVCHPSSRLNSSSIRWPASLLKAGGM